jgi:hypothetical protein
MSTTLQRLQGLDDNSDEIRPFGSYQEEAIIALSLDHPEFFTSVARFMKPEMFAGLECRWVMAEILNAFEKHNVVPSRPMLRDKLVGGLTEDDPWQKILELVDKPSNPREVPLIKDTLLKWAQDRAYGLIYSEEAQEAYTRGEYDELEAIIQDANRIADVGQAGFWFLDNYDLLFEPDVIDHRTTGFPKLDRLLNHGGPSPKEVVCWLAATNVGKCHTLQSKIIEKENSRIFILELEDGTILKLAGFREIQTTRGRIKVKDLTEDDSITEIPTGSDPWDLELSNM